MEVSWFLAISGKGASLGSCGAQHKHCNEKQPLSWESFGIWDECLVIPALLQEDIIFNSSLIFCLMFRNNCTFSPSIMEMKRNAKNKDSLEFEAEF